MYRFATAIVVLFSACIACGHEHPCTAAEAQRAEAEALAETLHTWDSLHNSYTAYRQCDDGVIAEGYSESVARILVDHWSTLPRLAYLGRKDTGFRRFVLAHIDATLDVKDLKKIRAKGNAQCPSALRVVCAEVAKQADAALKEDASLGIK
jgi:hypothetical protein